MMRDLIQLLLPHFVTEAVGCYLDDDDVLYTAISMDAFEEEEDPTPAAVVTVKSLSWLGKGWLGRTIDEPVDYDEWQAKRIAAA